MTFLRTLNLLLAVLLACLVAAKWEKWQTRMEGFPIVVATVDGRPIYARDLLSAAQIDGKPASQTRLQLTLQRLIRLEVVSEKAGKTEVPEREIAALRRSVSHQFIDKEPAALHAAGITEATLHARLENHLRVESWLRKFAALEPTEAECRAWFSNHPEIASMPDVAQASHFAAIFPPNGTVFDFLSKGDLIRDAQARLKDGVPFPQLIDALSDDPAKPVTHGSLSWFGRDRMEPALVAAAFTQPLHQVGAAVETRFGFHLILVLDRFPARSFSYEQVASEVRQRCRAELERQKIEALVTDLAQRAKVEIHDPRLIL